MIRESSTALETFLRSYEAASGFKARRIGREWRMLCPVHELDGAGHTPSMAVWQRPDGSVAFNCMGGICKYSTVASKLASLGVSVKVSPEQMARAREGHDAERQSKLAAAQRVFEKCEPLLLGSPAAWYLDRRGLLDGLSTDSPNYRFVRTLDSGRQLICLIATPRTIHDKTILLQAVSILHLHDDGSPKMNGIGKKWRQVTGLLKGNGIVIGQWSRDMVIGEGFESTLAAMRLLGESFGIAAVTSANMPNIEPPAGVKHVWIAQDNDVSGLIQGAKTAERLRSEGYDVTRVRWGSVGEDAADEWKRRHDAKVLEEIGG